MQGYSLIKAKLAGFLRKFYLNELLKGSILFLGLGLGYFLLLLFLEHFLWLGPVWRGILFWTFLGVEAFLLLRFILIPLLKLFRLRKGLDEKEVSRRIGQHFPEVDDKLLNLLQLVENGEKSDLLLAGIEQKSKELGPVPFASAIDFRSSLSYLKYAALPIGVVLVVLWSGNSRVFADSYERIRNYERVYEPPAPFRFVLENEKLEALEGEEFSLEVRTEGRLRPGEVRLDFRGQSFFMREVEPGKFRYSFDPLVADVEFSLSGGGVVSETYRLEMLPVPMLRDLVMFLDYPSYTGRKDERIHGSGNAEVPEGTEIRWEVATEDTERVDFAIGDSVASFGKEGEEFSYEKHVFGDMAYQIRTSNQKVTDYEVLDYSVGVIKDQYPELELEQRVDTINNETRMYFHGRVSDDYGVKGVRLIYHPTQHPESEESLVLAEPEAELGEFFAAFPDTLELQGGREYSLYFEVSDNDGIRNSKSIQSERFRYRKLSSDEIEEARMEEQGEALEGLQEMMQQMEMSEERLSDFFDLQKQKGGLDYRDRKEVEQLLERQLRQNELMREATEKFKRNLGDEEEGGDTDRQKELEEKLERQEERLSEEEDFLRELEELNRKMEEEGLMQGMEELSGRKRNQERSMEQLVEATKRFYVERKLERWTSRLERLSKEQERLSRSGLEGKEAQDSLGGAFDGLRQEMEELEEENSELKSPMPLGRDRELEESIQQDLQKASEELGAGNAERAKEEQESAAEKMQRLSRAMRQQQTAGSREMLQEDAERLRQILDNLLVFSFSQEDLMGAVRMMGRNDVDFGRNLRLQNQLRENFEHVDDSIYALALRNPFLSEEVFELLGDIEYDLGNTLERLSQNELSRGLASQQYVMANTNELAQLLNRILENMRRMANPPRGGSGEGEPQLSDIIRKQGELNEEMRKKLEERGTEGERSERTGEETSGEVFEIFKEQQRLRRALEEELRRMGQEGTEEGPEAEMQRLEEELLENGLREETLERMMRLEEQLMQLEDSEMEKGRSPERESETGREQHRAPDLEPLPTPKEYFGRNELLIRQSLPLRPVYQQKVRQYFERRED